MSKAALQWTVAILSIALLALVASVYLPLEEPADPTTTTTVYAVGVSDTVPGIPWSAAREIWLDVVRERSAELAEITWVDLATDDLLLAILDMTCTFYDEGGTIEETAGALARTAEDTYGSEFNDDDIKMADYVAGASSATCEYR